jgi:HPt (histidine-containing phosphotransfer) domain-containing protein
MDPSLIDRATFTDLRENVGAEFVAELVDTFLEEAPGMLAQLRTALALSDADAYRRAAHSLKSNANTFGAHGLASKARDLELGGFDADMALNVATLDALDAACAEAAAELKVMSRG